MNHFEDFQKNIFRLVLLITLLLSPFCAGTLNASEPLSVGTGKVEITPAVGTPLSGYGKLRGKETKGIHDPIFARSIALTQGGQTFVLLSLDLCMIDAHLRETVYEKISKQSGRLKPEQFLIFATHTHSGAGAIGGRFWQKFIMGKFNKKTFEHLTDQAAQSVLTALDNQVPAKAEYGQIPIDDLIENRMIPKLKYPHQLKILRFLNQDGRVIAHMISMAAHPTLFPAKELLFSADYPGALTQALDNDYPGSAAVFINGAAGDLRPHPPHGPDKLTRMNLFSEQLITRARTLTFEPAALEGPWQAVLMRSKLPRVKVRAGWFKVPSVIGNRFFPRKTYFQGLRMGPFILLSTPGEMSSELGFEAEKRVLNAGLTPLIVGYANDYIGYIIPRRYYSNQEEYEARVTFYGKKLDLYTQKKSEQLLQALLTQEEKAALNRPGRLEFNDGLPVLNLRGSSYHVGFEEGRLLSAQIDQGLDQVFSYFRHELKVPLINRLIIYWVATRAWKKLEPFLNYDELQQIRGIADGADISYSKLKQIHAMPELFPTLCTNGAYWGDATQSHELIAIRNLDWNREMGVFKLASVKYYDAGLNPSYVNIGYAGFSGVLSGINDEGISVGQIGATSEDQTLEGLGMPFLMKRVLEESKDLTSVESIFRRSDLTQGYNYVISDALAREAIVIEATHSHLSLFRDNDPKEAEVDYALSLKNAVFRGDPALDPVIRDLQWASKGKPNIPGLEPPGGSAYNVRYLRHGQLVQENYGSITPEIAKSIAREIAPGSNIQSVVYYYPYFEIANAEEDLRAVDAPYHQFDLRDFKDAA